MYIWLKFLAYGPWFIFLLSVALSVKCTSCCSTFASTMWAGWSLSDVVVLLFLLGIVGEIGESNDEYYIWTHKKLDIGYNGDQIVDVTLTSESKTKLSPNAKISFTYEVKQSLLLVLCTINCYKDFYDWWWICWDKMG